MRPDELDGVVDAEPGRKADLLQHNPDAAACDGVSRVEPEQRRPAGIGAAQADDDRDGGGLAGPVRAEQSEHLAPPQLEIDARERLDGGRSAWRRPRAGRPSNREAWRPAAASARWVGTAAWMLGGRARAHQCPHWTGSRVGGLQPRPGRCRRCAPQPPQQAAGRDVDGREAPAREQVRHCDPPWPPRCAPAKSAALTAIAPTRPSGSTRTPSTSPRQTASSWADLAVETMLARRASPRERCEGEPRRMAAREKREEHEARRRTRATSASPVGASGGRRRRSSAPRARRRPRREHQAEPERRLRSRRAAADREEVERRLVDAVGADERIDAAVEEAADGSGGERERLDREEEALRDVTRLQQREPVRARAVLEARAPENRRSRRRAPRSRATSSSYGVSGAELPGRIERAELLEDVTERVVVVERLGAPRPAGSPRTARAGRARRPTGRSGAPAGSLRAFP